MKVLYVESGGNNGGSFESLYQTLVSLDKMEVKPLVVLMIRNSPYEEKIKALGIKVLLIRDPVFSAPNKLTSKLLFKIQALIDKYFSIFSITFESLLHYKLISELLSIIKTNQIQIIHLNDQPALNFFGFMLKKKSDVLIISHIRSTRPKSFNEQKSRFANLMCNQFIANSRNTMNYWEKFGIDSGKTTVLYNGISIVKTKPYELELFSPNLGNDGRIVICCVANFLPEKGHFFLVEVFSKFIEKSNRNAYLLLVGEGPLRKTLQDKVFDLGLNDRIIFTGYQQDSLGIIKASDIVIIPSQSESFGRVAIEAMLVGTAIIATSVGGLPEVVKHDTNGVLVEFGDVDSAVIELDSLLNDEVRKYGYEKNATRDVENNFTIDVYVRKLIKLYLKIMSK